MPPHFLFLADTQNPAGAKSQTVIKPSSLLRGAVDSIKKCGVGLKPDVGFCRCLQRWEEGHPFN